jgi:hypothetical protein
MATDNETLHEFEFPDAADEKAKGAVAAGEDEIEIVDDTPPVDKGRTASATPPVEPTEDELKSYSESVQKRFKQFTKGYHDERRAKESAQREREEAVRLAQAVFEENKKLKAGLSQGHSALLETSKKAVEAEVESARRGYKEAYESFDAEKIAEAQEKLLEAKIKQDKLNNFRAPPLQQEKEVVQTQHSTQQQPRVDPKALAWQDKNQWFGADTEMTGYALALHRKLVEEDRINPSSDEYYERLDKTIRKRFPENFEAAQEARRGSVVAPASRTTAPRKITLTSSQVAVANKLGVPLKEYAKQVALMDQERK